MNIQRKISSSRFSVVGEEAGIDVLEAPRSLDRAAAVERWRDEQSFKSLALQEPWAQRKLLLCARDFETLPGYAKALLHALTLP